jgi:hypothetical protein
MWKSFAGFPKVIWWSLLIFAARETVSLGCGYSSG